MPIKKEAWDLIKILLWVGAFAVLGWLIASIHDATLRLLATVGICILMSLLITVNVK
jgi:hypothetical protein